MKTLSVMICGIFALVALWSVGPAIADTSPEYSRCIKASYVDTDMRACDRAESDRQDLELNALYKQAMARLDVAGRQRLRTQERAWLKRQRAECEKIYAEDKGTSSLANGDGCYLTSTDKRIGELRALVAGR